MACEIYVVMTSRQTWGKGPDPLIAMYHACQHYDDIEQAQFYRFHFPDGFKLHDGTVCDVWLDALRQINVDGLGAVSYPKGIEPEDLGVMRVKGIPAKFQTINRKLEDFLYGKPKG